MKTLLPQIKIYIDEAWRWPFAWPVHVWLICFIEKIDLSEFKDSKKCCEKLRSSLFKKLLDLEQKWTLLQSIGSATASEIDLYWMTTSLNLALSRWLFEILQKIFHQIVAPVFEKNFWQLDLDTTISYHKLKKIFAKKNIYTKNIAEIISIYTGLKLLDWIFLDWNSDFGLSKELWIKIITIIDGDDKIPWISAASIIAKVSRDNLMLELAKKKKYKIYGFEKHKWYWTKLHTETIKEYWASDIHRKLFLKKLYEKIWLETNLPNNFTKKPLKILENSHIIKFKKEKLLLHICCAPDLTRPLELLKDVFDLYLLWYNPNITDPKEYKKRFEAYTKLLKIHWKSKIIHIENSSKEYFKYLFQNKNLIWFQQKISEKIFLEKISKMTEQSDRCLLCYMLRLEKAAQIGAEKWIKYFTTTLSISPKKEFNKIIKAWELVKKTFPEIKYLAFDFKKNNWYKKSCQLTKKYWIWRQDYCGCEFSKRNIKKI